MGIYAGNGYLWAAPQTGRNINLQPIYTSEVVPVLRTVIPMWDN